MKRSTEKLLSFLSILAGITLANYAYGLPTETHMEKDIWMGWSALAVISIYPAFIFGYGMTRIEDDTGWDGVDVREAQDRAFRGRR